MQSYCKINEWKTSDATTTTKVRYSVSVRVRHGSRKQKTDGQTDSARFALSLVVDAAVTVLHKRNDK